MIEKDGNIIDPPIELEVPSPHGPDIMHAWSVASISMMKQQNLSMLDRNLSEIEEEISKSDSKNQQVFY